MERLAFEIHPLVEQLCCIHNRRTSAADSHDASTSNNSMVLHIEARRALRRLDRCLTALLEQHELLLQQDDDTTAVQLSDELTDDLLQILLHLQTDTTVAMVDDTSHDWTQSSWTKAATVLWQSGHVLASQDWVMLVQERLRTMPCLAALHLLNHAWGVGQRRRLPSLDWTVSLLLTQLLPVAQASLQANHAPGSGDDEDDDQEEEAEMRVQWRILTGILLEEVVLLFQQDDDDLEQVEESPASRPSPTEWLEPPPQNQQQQQPSLPKDLEVDHPGDTYSCSRPSTSTNELVSQLLVQWQRYATDLVDYALDALDGAAQVQAIQEQEMSRTDNQDEEEEDEAILVQECLRHVTLATNALDSLLTLLQHDTTENNNNHNKNGIAATSALVATLYKTMVTSFMTSNSNDKVLLEASVVEELLRLTELALTTTTQVSTVSLGTTVLRSIPHPELLLAATRVWTALPKCMEQDTELVRVVQVAAWTLQCELQRKSCSAATSTLLDRLLALLNERSLSQQPQEDPWDALFARHVMSGAPSAGATATVTPITTEAAFS